MRGAEPLADGGPERPTSASSLSPPMRREKPPPLAAATLCTCDTASVSHNYAGTHAGNETGILQFLPLCLLSALHVELI